METLKTEDRSIQTKGRESRTQSIATRFTRAEEQALKKRAEASGQNLREWAREVLLRVDANDKRAEMEMHLFTELVGIEMLMMKTLEPILLGEKLERDQIALLFRQVRSSKGAKAQEILIRRNLKHGP